MDLCPIHQVWPKHNARYGERGKKTRHAEEGVERQHQGIDRPGVFQVPEGSREQGKIEQTGCEIICGAPMTLTVKGLMMMKMMQWVLISVSPYLYVFISVSLGGLCMCPHLYMSHLCVPLTPSLTLYPSTPNLSLT